MALRTRVCLDFNGKQNFSVPRDKLASVKSPGDSLKENKSHQQF